MAAQCVEPFQNRAVARERSKPDLVERLFKAENAQSLFLGEQRPPIALLLLDGDVRAHVAEQEVPTGRQRGDPARFLILRPADAVPPVNVEVLPLNRHFMPCEQVRLLVDFAIRRRLDRLLDLGVLTSQRLRLQLLLLFFRRSLLAQHQQLLVLIVAVFAFFHLSCFCCSLLLLLLSVVDCRRLAAAWSDHAYG